ncbi:MAG TPA: F0F1 ATP synthase subunit A [bacterium]|nr:F0F1 ATP synthase subunit A [bacterium]
MPHGFSFATLLFGLDPEEAGLLAKHFQPTPLFHALLSTLILLLLVLLTRKAVLSKGDDLLPDERLTVRNFFEGLIQFILGLMEDIIGPHYRRYVPLIMGLWFYILFANLFGLLPFFAPATDKWSVTISMAIVVFVATHLYGIQAHGLGYFKHFISPVWPPTAVLWILSPIYLMIEIIGHFARVLSLSIRLMANMMADHMVVTIFLFLLAPLVPAMFTGLGIIVCFLQAFVFSVLAIIYIALATAHEGGHEEEAEEHAHH